MGTYIMLARLSPEGMKTLRNNPNRIQEVNQEVERLGARVVSQYALLGPYDFITVLEAPDAETVSRVSVELASRATASYETLTAISVEEFSSRLRGEEGRHEVGGSQLTPEPTSTGGGRPESTAAPTEGVTSEPPRTEPIGGPPSTVEAPPPRTAGIEEGALPRAEGAPPREGAVADDLPPRTERSEEPPPLGREDARRQTQRGQEEEDKGLMDRARDAILGEEEEPRGRREGTDRPPEDRR